ARLTRVGRPVPPVGPPEPGSGGPRPLGHLAAGGCEVGHQPGHQAGTGGCGLDVGKGVLDRVVARWARQVVVEPVGDPRVGQHVVRVVYLDPLHVDGVADFTGAGHQLVPTLDGYLEAEDAAAGLRTDQPAVAPERHRRLVRVHGHLGDCLCAVHPAAPAQVHERVGGPCRLVQVERVLAHATVEGYQSLLLAS